ncbi:hypothetical protein [Beggiatoa leptomitoformis]|uniref:DUF4276 family protein n=1 Tax=Beggiatoa leptomitoformis TaxID=288004 RepID=A0A2N9YDQ0_9GAMM|nr:hypothetical protein [Beggiatoa leptomitoformis]ALG69098.1 hypothetical protein AL038_17160 [Beggiatoa leptomitoformis]AUI68489.1 hypothetical protein BLE401_07075 [Beggiatoa leptomitoformis]
MSNLRIALVAEGPTDYEIIQAALKAILPAPFVLTRLQPEASPSRPQMGNGWCGVLKWCREMSKQCSGNIDTEPTLELFDWIILHIDVDVAATQYSDCGANIQQESINLGWQTLPCTKPCPPVVDTVAALQQVVESWLKPASASANTVFCLPAQSSGTWLAAAHLPDEHLLFGQMECNLTLENRLADLPVKSGLRIRKSKREYQQHAPKITEQWERVKQHCSQAQVFESAILNLLSIANTP